MIKQEGDRDHSTKSPEQESAKNENKAEAAKSGIANTITIAVGSDRKSGNESAKDSSTLIIRREDNDVTKDFMYELQVADKVVIKSNSLDGDANTIRAREHTKNYETDLIKRDKAFSSTSSSRGATKLPSKNYP